QRQARRPSPTRRSSDLRTRADQDVDGWRISGAKQFISTAEHAGTFLLFARTDQETPGAAGISSFILDADHVRVTGREEKLGLNSDRKSTRLNSSHQIIS